MKFIFLIIIIFIFYVLFNNNNFKQKKVIKKKFNKTLENNLLLASFEHNPSFKFDMLHVPDFRGINKSTQIAYKSEYGGIKPFQNINLDNSNLTNNKIDFKNYNSYRIKSYTVN